MPSVNPFTLIFLGPQGSGKGTHVDMLLKRFDEKDKTLPTVSFEAGKNLREFAAGKEYTAGLMRDTMARGELLPLFLSTHAFSDYLTLHMQGHEHLILDGFPRTEDQLPVLDSAMQFYKRVSPKVVHIKISDEEAMKRLLLRKRADDTEEGIRKRLLWTREQQGPIHEWFRAQSNYEFIEIQGEQSIEDVHKDILAALHIA